ncbi:hypothetical protein [Treponema zioleckii]|uniref:hypothetical protein n=1 Tax=Treponema zioleckii TaxID=331680 RepID=UPI00168A51DB|nr:hypothetical protein [Treponema zioleckii]
MNEKQVIYILAGIAALIYAALLISLPIRRKKTLSAAGNLLVPLQNGLTYRVVGIFIVSALIIAFVPTRKFAFYIAVILFAVAIIATNMSVQEAVGLGKAGIYENIIISGTAIVKMQDIYALPTLEYEDDPDTVAVDKRIIEIIRQNGAKVILAFPTVEERHEAVKAILKQRPELKPSK